MRRVTMATGPSYSRRRARALCPRRFVAQSGHNSNNNNNNRGGNRNSNRQVKRRRPVLGVRAASWKHKRQFIFHASTVRRKRQVVKPCCYANERGQAGAANALAGNLSVRAPLIVRCALAPACGRLCGEPIGLVAEEARLGSPGLEAGDWPPREQTETKAAPKSSEANSKSEFECECEFELAFEFKSKSKSKLETTSGITIRPLRRRHRASHTTTTQANANKSLWLDLGGCEELCGAFGVLFAVCGQNSLLTCHLAGRQMGRSLVAAEWMELNVYEVSSKPTDAIPSGQPPERESQQQQQQQPPPTIGLQLTTGSAQEASKLELWLWRFRWTGREADGGGTVQILISQRGHFIARYSGKAKPTLANGSEALGGSGEHLNRASLLRFAASHAAYKSASACVGRLVLLLACWLLHLGATFAKSAGKSESKSESESVSVRRQSQIIAHNGGAQSGAQRTGNSLIYMIDCARPASDKSGRMRRAAISRPPARNKAATVSEPAALISARPHRLRLRAAHLGVVAATMLLLALTCLTQSSTLAQTEPPKLAFWRKLVLTSLADVLPGREQAGERLALALATWPDQRRAALFYLEQVARRRDRQLTASSAPEVEWCRRASLAELALQSGEWRQSASKQGDKPDRLARDELVRLDEIAWSGAKAASDDSHSRNRRIRSGNSSGQAKRLNERPELVEAAKLAVENANLINRLLIQAESEPIKSIGSSERFLKYLAESKLRQLARVEPALHSVGLLLFGPKASRMQPDPSNWQPDGGAEDAAAAEQRVIFAPLAQVAADRKPSQVELLELSSHPVAASRSSANGYFGPVGWQPFYASWLNDSVAWRAGEARLEHGRWFSPYLDCGLSNKWLLTYSIPIGPLNLTGPIDTDDDTANNNSSNDNNHQARQVIR